MEDTLKVLIMIWCLLMEHNWFHVL